MPGEHPDILRDAILPSLRYSPSFLLICSSKMTNGESTSGLIGFPLLFPSIRPEVLCLIRYLELKGAQILVTVAAQLPFYPYPPASYWFCRVYGLVLFWIVYCALQQHGPNWNIKNTDLSKWMTVNSLPLTLEVRSTFGGIFVMTNPKLNRRLRHSFKTM